MFDAIVAIDSALGAVADVPYSGHSRVVGGEVVGAGAGAGEEYTVALKAAGAGIAAGLGLRHRAAVARHPGRPDRRVDNVDNQQWSLYHHDVDDGDSDAGVEGEDAGELPAHTLGLGIPDIKATIADGSPRRLVRSNLTVPSGWLGHGKGGVAKLSLFRREAKVLEVLQVRQRLCAHQPQNALCMSL